MSTRASVKVWDPLVRLFHWSLALAFTLAYASGEQWRDLHVVAGYCAGGLVVARLVWGLVGTRHARFNDFVRAPAAVKAYLLELLSGSARRYLGHNPAGGAMIVLLLASLAGTVSSGLVLYAVADNAGLLAGVWPAWASHEALLEETHELFANFTLMLVFVHVAGVAVSSLLHRENLVRAMITGRKPQEVE